MLLGHLCNHVPSIQLLQEVHVVQNQCTQPDTRIQLECRSFIKTSTNRASPQKMHFTAWCFVSDIEFTCLHQLPLLRRRLFSGASSQLCLNWTLYLSLQVLWYRALLALNVASKSLLSFNQLNRKDLGSNPRSLNLLRCPARML